LRLAHSSASKVAVPVLIEGLRCEDAHLRQQAAAALGRIPAKSNEAVAALVQPLDDPDQSVRCECIRSIGEIGLATENVISGLIGALSDATHSIRENACSVLGQIGPDASEALAELRRLSMCDKFPSVRQAAARAMQEISMADATQSAK
jgi:HEAT repeat protein